MRIKPVKQFFRALTPPPDKSITIRAVIMGLLASGTTVVRNPLLSGDTVAAIEAVSALGASVDFKGGALHITGGEIKSGTVDAKNSATVMRLLAGAIAGSNATVTIKGDKSLSSRSMSALVGALKLMGASISGEKPPVTVVGSKLSGIDFCPSSPSAQIKSAVLLAGLSANGETTVRETIKTRPHTEDMLKDFGADIKTYNGVINLRPSKLTATEITVPGDVSSAAYPIALALKKGYCFVKNVGKARRELIDFLISIGGDIAIDFKGNAMDLTVNKSTLKPFSISGSLSTALIDELPLLAVLASSIEGESVITDAAALRNKECDRIKQTVINLRNMGVDITELKDGFKIRGGVIRGGNVVTKGDHRIAMSMAVACALSVSGGVIDDEDCVEISYPSFWELFL
ncbi:MAG: 3-phosphoshikimate 1-carboxyvinyltransferase [Clostridia bacterium]|nr:3-phosphoshikimate 1-carboxyvinyltransferase [Clostridia bacterium]